ncbi:hypothetical protein ABZS61_18290 [Streptomyces sp. NPDC005566]|uniref:hypothetical protein n=1 Tax=Streptomyces sp. NPDC005566 TaxID=3156886 RepID=UPI0033A88EF7
MRRVRFGPSAVESTERPFGAAAGGNLFTEIDPARAAAAVAWDEPRAELLLSGDRR